MQLLGLQCCDIFKSPSLVIPIPDIIQLLRLRLKKKKGKKSWQPATEEAQKGNSLQLHSAALRNDHIDSPEPVCVVYKCTFSQRVLQNSPRHDNVKPPQLCFGYNSSILHVLELPMMSYLCGFQHCQGHSKYANASLWNNP